ncbi:MAG: hypothetical protein ACOZBZ_02810 [Patescibacteria group bacterium]
MILLRIIFSNEKLVPPREVLRQIAKAVSQSAGGRQVFITAEQGKVEGATAGPGVPFYPILALYDCNLNEKPEEIEEMIARALGKAPFAPEEKNRSIVHFLISATPASKALADLPWLGWA